jgi:hypothetical protein
LEPRFLPWASIFVPDEMLVLKVIDLPATGVSAHFIVRFELFAGQDGWARGRSSPKAR